MVGEVVEAPVKARADSIDLLEVAYVQAGLVIDRDGKADPCDRIGGTVLFVPAVPGCTTIDIPVPKYVEAPVATDRNVLIIVQAGIDAVEAHTSLREEVQGMIVPVGAQFHRRIDSLNECAYGARGRRIYVVIVDFIDGAFGVQPPGTEGDALGLVVFGLAGCRRSNFLRTFQSLRRLSYCSRDLGN